MTLGLQWWITMATSLEKLCTIKQKLTFMARDLHKQHIESVVNEALSSANVNLQDLDAVAVTVKPGLALSLRVGLDYALKLVEKSGKPLIPIHHMEAHALTARMIQRIDFPFLVLLVSGGHCLLAVARGVSDFLLLGHGMDDSPGDAFDKTARQLKLKNLPQFAEVPGGVAIETLAKLGNPKAFAFPHVLTQTPNCHFSFAGIKFAAKRLIESEEISQDVSASSVLPNAADVCASFQFGVLQHLAKRVQRGLLFCELKGLLPETNKTLVVSGGVASNKFLRAGLVKVCDKYSCKVVCPPPKLCTDNGIMIAWNGMEKLLSQEDFAQDPENVDIQPRCPLGVDISEEVSNTALKLPRIKLLDT
ncbi:probable tRNA N6-adenosine threonylcarbamoyltransferase, mitochondrial isoform X2 [Gigantopelta aegis]|uniref:probable tRNA N6-adenosine threonylcarbamoyltransferase, mitochondrial isoform X2 n=1 Tax=Gigantopelta aegis TaxID=1735272 RepID=UPI001B88A553|nr:probable tRNA N6-adenosine threonylcarbamoyltransferase, mitochondrial isoform X2 [Gigantopelta aegis]